MNKILSLFILWALSSFFSTIYQPCYGDLRLNIKAEIGFDGHYKLGFWFPVRLQISNSSSDLKGKVRLELISQLKSEGGQIYTAPTFLARGSISEILLYLFADKVPQKLHFQLLSDSGQVIQEADFPLPFPSRHDEIFLLSLSSVRGDLDFLTALNLRSDAPQIRTFYMSEGQLLDKWQGYDSINFMVISEANLSNISESQRESLMGWILNGGRALIVGKNQSLSLKSGLLQEISPVYVSKNQVAKKLPALESRYNSNFEGEGEFLLTKSELKDRSKSVISESDGTPILSVRDIGSGQSLFLALDYALYPLDRWDGKDSLWREIISYSKSSALPFSADREASSLLRSVEENFPKPFYSISAFLAVYFACLCLIGYASNRRLRRAKLNWIAVPIVSAIFFFLASHPSAFSNVKISAYNISALTAYPELKRGSLYGYISIFTSDKSKYRFSMANSDRFFARPLTVYNPYFTSQNHDFIQAGGFEISEEPNATWSAKKLQFEAQLKWDMGEVEVEAESLEVLEVKNLTSINLDGAVLIAKDGYAKVGTLNKGEKRSVKLLRGMDSESKSSPEKLLGSSELRRQFLKTWNDIDSLLKLSHPSQSIVSGWTSDLNWMLKVDSKRNAKVQGETLLVIRSY